MKKYSFREWQERIHDRSDISGHVTHLTKDTDKKSYENLLNILYERRINGSDTNSGFIVGDSKAVCFQDAPLYGICQNAYYEQMMNRENGSKRRYYPVGLSFSKPYVYRKGGRPVIYENKLTAKRILPPEEWWRIVNFDLSDNESFIDWTHEREWRLKGDFEFELSEVYVLIVNQTFYKKFIDDVPEIASQVKGIVVLQPILE